MTTIEKGYDAKSNISKKDIKSCENIDRQERVAYQMKNAHQLMTKETNMRTV